MMPKVLAREHSSEASGPAPAVRVDKPGDAFEQEADHVADTVMSGGRVSSWSFSRVHMGALQRDRADRPTPSQQQPPKPDNYGEAAQKVLEAAIKTDAGQKVIQKVEKDPLIKDAKDFVTSTPGMIIAGTSAAGVVAGLTAAHKPLPMQLPAVPVDKVIPALKGIHAQIDIQGPLDRPTQITIGFSGTFGGGATEKKKTDDASGQIAKQTQALKASMDMFRPKAPAGSEDIGQLLELGKGAATPGFSIDDLAATPFPAPPAATQDTPVAQDSQAKKKEEIPVQRKQDNTAPLPPLHDTQAAPAAAPPSVESIVNASGRPLDRETRSFFGPRFGVDFSNVRIHNDVQAATSAAELNADAYTVGSSLVFGSRHYDPDSEAGRRLLAHELTHVVQQGSAGVLQPCRAGNAMTKWHKEVRWDH